MALTKPTFDVDNIQGIADLVQDQATELKVLFDKAGADIKTYLIALCDQLDLDFATKIDLTNAILGEFPDGSIEDIKLSNSAGQIKERLQTHIDDAVKHITAAERTAWNSIKSVSGTFTDTTTTIATGTEYTKTIPLGLTGVSGSCAVKGNVGNNTGSIVIFNTDINASTGLGNSNSSASITIKSNGNLGSFINDSTDNVILKNCYIDGANLKFIFRNNGASTKTLYVAGCTWEVQA